MKYFDILVPKHIKVLLYRMGIMILVLYICRIVFLLFNWSFFDGLTVLDFIIAFWFDLITVSILGLFYIPLYLLPIPFRNNRWYKLFFKIIFHVFNFFSIALNMIDIEYFKFVQKRSTYDVFAFTQNGSDLSQLLPTFLKDYWFLFIFAILLVALSEWLYRKTDRMVLKEELSLKFFLKGFAYMIAYLGIIIIIGRGVGLKPVGVLTASKYTQPQNISFVLNTTFTVIKTWKKSGVELKHYFEEEELVEKFNPYLRVGENKQFEQPNIVVLILESHSKEFFGYFNEGKGHTPFLDSLFQHSLVFTNAYSNGKQSIEAMPSIISSIPSLMDRPFINSIYKTNPITSLPQLLKEKGYYSAFFHGATNGSMNFDGFCGIAQFDDYFGRTEYGNDDDYDGTWGIDDELFLQYAVETMDDFKSPFFTSCFTLYPHHPYGIPKRHEGEFIDDEERLAHMLFASYSLKRFFDEAKKKDWYENTLFVITADHTPDSKKNYYRRRLGMYDVPIAFFMPGKTDWVGRNDKLVQQIDIMPSILDLIGYGEEFFAFGKSMFDSTYSGYAVQYTQSMYQIIQKNQLIMFGSDDKVKNVYDISSDSLLNNDLYSKGTYPNPESLDKLKAIIQTYNFSMVNNKLKVK